MGWDVCFGNIPKYPSYIGVKGARIAFIDSLSMDFMLLNSTS